MTQELRIFYKVQHYFSCLHYFISSRAWRLTSPTFTRCATSKGHETRRSSPQQILFCWARHTCRLAHLPVRRISGSPCYEFHAITSLIMPIDRPPFFLVRYDRAKIFTCTEIVISDAIDTRVKFNVNTGITIGKANKRSVWSWILFLSFGWRMLPQLFLLMWIWDVTCVIADNSIWRAYLTTYEYRLLNKRTKKKIW